MKYLILSLILSGCTLPKTYTNEQCIKKICDIDNCSSYSRPDRALAEMALSLECAKNNNDPDKTIKALKEQK